ncbi:MAG: hypothetical protein AAF557_13675 [Pseudomonadota bacterium]
MGPLLFAIGGMIIAAMGFLHGVFTARDEVTPKVLAPRDPKVLQAMQGARLGIARDTDLWRAWLGFNHSHPLGAMVFGLGCAVIGLFYPLALEEPLVLIAAPIIALIYLVLAVRYWFRTPAIGIAVALAFIIAGVLTA